MIKYSEQDRGDVWYTGVRPYYSGNPLPMGNFAALERLEQVEEFNGDP